MSTRSLLAGAIPKTLCDSAGRAAAAQPGFVRGRPTLSGRGAVVAVRFPGAERTRLCRRGRAARSLAGGGGKPTPARTSGASVRSPARSWSGTLQQPQLFGAPASVSSLRSASWAMRRPTPFALVDPPPRPVGEGRQQLPQPPQPRPARRARRRAPPRRARGRPAAALTGRRRRQRSLICRTSSRSKSVISASGISPSGGSASSRGCSTDVATRFASRVASSAAAIQRLAGIQPGDRPVEDLELAAGGDELPPVAPLVRRRGGRSLQRLGHRVGPGQLDVVAGEEVDCQLLEERDRSQLPDELAADPPVEAVLAAHVRRRRDHAGQQPVPHSRSSPTATCPHASPAPAFASVLSRRRLLGGGTARWRIGGAPPPQPPPGSWWIGPSMRFGNGKAVSIRPPCSPAGAGARSRGPAGGGTTSVSLVLDSTGRPGSCGSAMASCRRIDDASGSPIHRATLMPQAETAASSTGRR